MKFCVVVPTYNAGRYWGKWLQAFSSQSIVPDMSLIIDSSSTDGTSRLAEDNGFDVVKINKIDFNHGGTRQFALNRLIDYDIIVYFTQDAILSNPNSLERIISTFDDASTGASYGRQLPRTEAGLLEQYERNYNYPPNSLKKRYLDRTNYGVKTPFISNSFAAYRVNALQEVGGFPPDVIMAEDMYVAARMLLAGWSIYYCSEATVYHSHDYNLRELFGRYFDTGVFHNRDSWIQKNFGKAGSEGRKYALSEILYLWRNKPALIPYSILRNAIKFFGYRLGFAENHLPLSIKKLLSMHKEYWK